MHQEDQLEFTGEARRSIAPYLSAGFRHFGCIQSDRFFHAITSAHMRTGFLASHRNQTIAAHSIGYKSVGSSEAELRPKAIRRAHRNLRFLFGHHAKINRHTELIESPVSHSKQRTGYPINRHTSRCYPARQECFPKPYTLTSIPNPARIPLGWPADADSPPAAATVLESLSCSKSKGISSYA
jgi:hypothetical protein